jgi:hypothetical protein
MAGCCRGVPQRALCAPACPPAPCTPDWTVSAFAASAPAIVAVASRFGSVIGSGFWVTTSSILTSWSVVGREAQGVRVVIQLPSGVPMSLDGVVTYAIPGQGLALVSVNPDLYVGSYTPLLLPIASRISVGQEVYSISSTFADQDTNSFAVGHIRESSFTGVGTITDVQTTIPFYPASAGAPVIRKSDGAVVSIVQYQIIYPPSSSPILGYLTYFYGTTAVSSSYSSGVSSTIVKAFLSQAGLAANSGAAVTGTGYFPGAVTYPTLQDNYALGLFESAGEEGEGFAYQAAVPLIAAGIQPQQLSVGAPSTGAIVYDPTVELVDDDHIGTGNLTLNENGAVYGNYTAMDVGYVRISTNAYTDIRGTESAFQLEMDAVTGKTTYEIPDGKVFIYASDSNGGNLVLADIISPEGDPFIYGLTVTSFGVFGSTNTYLLDVLTFLDIYVSLHNEICPFFSSDFVIPQDEQTSTLNYASINVGTPGYPLSVWVKEETSQLTFQWDGYSLKTGDPVSFQAVVTIGNPDDSVVGQVRFNYGTMPGTWSGGKWLVGSNTTTNPNQEQLDYQKRQLINVVDQPRTGESIYFGRSSLQSSMQLPLAANASLSDRIKNRVAAPALLPDGTLPPLAINTHYPVVLTPLPPPATEQTRVVSGTICQYDSETSTFSYNLVTYTWTATPIQITSIAGNTIGTVALNVPSLTDAIIATGKINGTQAAPLTVAPVQALSLSNGQSFQLTAAQLLSMVQGNRSLGIPPTVNNAPYSPTAKFDWTPANAYYTSTLLYAPVNSGTRSVPNILSAHIKVSFNPADLFTSDGEGGLTPTKVIVVQLAATDSTSLLTQFGNDISMSCLVYYGDHTEINDDDEIVYFFKYQYRSGYGGNIVSTSSASSSTAGTVTKFAMMWYTWAGTYTQRPNVIVVGHPPRAGNSQLYSPYGSSTAPPTPDLIPFALEFSLINVAPMTSASNTISGKTFAITTERNAVNRPSFVTAMPLIPILPVST